MNLFNQKVKSAFTPSSGFAAGTLVHMRDGTKPIEQVKVGDEVLSKAENGEKAEYKRVLNIFMLEPETVIKVGYVVPDRPKLIHKIITTRNHPFWVVGEEWKKAKNLPFGPNTFGKKIELADGSHVEVGWSDHIYVSDESDVGWIPSYMGDVCKPGALWDLVNNRFVSSGVMALEEIQEFEMDDPYFKLPTYNLEVEDFHTFYVGEHGVLVHGDANILKAKAV